MDPERLAVLRTRVAAVLDGLEPGTPEATLALELAGLSDVPDLIAALDRAELGQA